MKRISRTVVAVAGLWSALFCVVDMQVKAAPLDSQSLFNWTGFYIGGQGGWADKQNGFRYINFDVAGRINGGFGGVGGGYNWQVGNSVIGVEADYSWANLKASVTGAGCGTGTVCGSRIDQFATFRARLGTLLTSTILLYGTVGGAWADTESRIDDTLIGSFHRSNDRFGWTVGGGVEAALASHWTAKFEALYIDVGQHRYPPKPGLLSFTQADNFMIYRAGVNYRF
jgi:outer membrane immunogenic protein